MKKKGDTLIEVALAIGIFSMIAITVMSVISASTTGAQSSLEVTLAREELDAQAEALRFIHDSYVSGSQAAKTSAEKTNPYYQLWEKIVDHAYSDAGHANSLNDALDYNPSLCSDLYRTGAEEGFLNDNGGKKPFIINTRRLGNISDAVNINTGAIDPTELLKAVNSIVISSGESTPTNSFSGTTYKVFYEPSTFPRLIYGSGAVSGEEDASLLSQATESSTTLRRAEGIFIIARTGTSNNVASGAVRETTTYYDFYIRSCWTPLNSDRASTISTVVRLYDPAVITY